MMSSKNIFSQKIQIIKIIELDSSFFKFKLNDSIYYGVSKTRLFNATYKLSKYNYLTTINKEQNEIIKKDSFLLNNGNETIKFQNYVIDSVNKENFKLVITEKTKKKTNTKVIVLETLVIVLLVFFKIN